MSFLIGPLTGGLVAGALYYSSSHAIESRTKALQHNLHQLSTQLQDPTVPQPTPASAKIVYSPFRETLKRRWNEQVESGANAVRDLEIPWDSIWNQLKKFGGQ